MLHTVEIYHMCTKTILKFIRAAHPMIYRYTDDGLSDRIIIDPSLSDGLFQINLLSINCGKIRLSIYPINVDQKPFRLI